MPPLPLPLERARRRQAGIRPWEGSRPQLPFPSSQPSCHPYSLGCPLPQGRAQSLPDKARSSRRVKGNRLLRPAWLTEGHRALQSPGQVGVRVASGAPRASFGQLRRTSTQLRTAEGWLSGQCWGDCRKRPGEESGARILLGYSGGRREGMLRPGGPLCLCREWKQSPVRGSG